jgi:hypothetical protein
MGAIQANQLERDVSADGAEVIILVRHDREQLLRHFLDEEPWVDEPR